MNQQQPSSDEPMPDELIAYLDGELNTDAMAVIEKRLSEESQYRDRLQALQKSWDLLDYLPRSEASESFTKTTIEMVAVTAAKNIEKEKDSAATLRRFGWLAVAGLVAAAWVGGFILNSYFLATDNRQLVEDLLVIENVDIYRNADNVDFLIRLDQEGLFAEEMDDGM